MVFGPAGALCRGSNKNRVGPARVLGFAGNSAPDHRTVTDHKSENLIEVAGALGQGAPGCLPMGLSPVGPSARPPDGELSGIAALRCKDGLPLICKTRVIGVEDAS